MRMFEWLRTGSFVSIIGLSCAYSAWAKQGGSELSAVTPAQVDEIFSPWNRADSPGCAVSIVHNGGTVYTRGYGMADLSHDAPIGPATPFHVASVSKQFTAAAVILLEQQGTVRFLLKLMENLLSRRDWNY